VRARVVGAAAVLIACEGAALANGRFPAASMLVAQPGDASHLVLRATYGVLFSNDGGGSWDWVCEKPLGYGGAEDPSVVVTGSGATVVGAFKAMARSSDRGCTWRREAGWPAGVVDMALRPSAPDRLYAISTLYARSTDAGAEFRSALLVSEDGGESWSSRGAIDPSLLLDSVEVAPSDPSRVYVSAIRPRGRATAGVVLVSDDDGRHWSERAFTFAPTDRGLFIAAVDAKRRDRLYLRTSGPEANRVAVSDDGGRTSRVVFVGESLQGFALGDDGATVYVGGAKDGLQRASASELRFDRTWANPVQCLTMVEGTLWACTSNVTGFVLGTSVDRGVTFTPKLTLAGMRGPVACADGGTAAECAADWAALRQLVGVDARADAGVERDAGTPPAPPGPRKACGCSTPGAPAGPWGGCASVALAIAVQARRRDRGSRSRLAARGSPF
jgi:hypothetical protein